MNFQLPFRADDIEPLPPARVLSLATLFYLALPLALFVGGWLRPMWSILCLALLGIGVWSAARGVSGAPVEWENRDAARRFWQGVALIYAPIAFFTLFGGAGGFGVVSMDWLNKHDLILADLSRFRWPVAYAASGSSLGQGPFFLVYYIAYYLPASVIGQLFGWTAANFALQVWTQIGMFLVALWLRVLIGPRAAWAGLLFVVFSGAVLLGTFIKGARLQDSSDLWWKFDPRFYVLYRSNIMQLFWAPQHLLAGSLGAALLMRRQNASNISFDAVVLTLLPLWSPFAFIGCAPFALWNMARAFKKTRVDWLCLGSCAVLLVVLALFFASRLPVSLAPRGLLSRGQSLEFLPPAMWRNIGWRIVPLYALFFGLSFGALWLISWPLLRGQSAWMRPYAALAALTLSILPFFQYGFYNDLMMRSAIPAFWVLGCMVARALKSNGPQAWPRRAALLFLLAMGLNQPRLYLRDILHLRRLVSIPRLASLPPLLQQYEHDPRGQLVTQYVGNSGSFFARWLQKR